MPELRRRAITWPTILQRFIRRLAGHGPKMADWEHAVYDELLRRFPRMGEAVATRNHRLVSAYGAFRKAILRARHDSKLDAYPRLSDKVFHAMDDVLKKVPLVPAYLDTVAAA